MKSKFLSIKFFARKKKNNPNLLYLLVRITYQGKRTELSLNREFDANLWDDVRKRFKGYSKLSTSNNVLLEEVKFQLLDIPAQQSLQLRSLRYKHFTIRFD